MLLLQALIEALLVRDPGARLGAGPAGSDNDYAALKVGPSPRRARPDAQKCTISPRLMPFAVACRHTRSLVVTLKHC